MDSASCDFAQNDGFGSAGVSPATKPRPPPIKITSGAGSSAGTPFQNGALKRIFSASREANPSRFASLTTTYEFCKERIERKEKNRRHCERPLAASEAWREAIQKTLSPTPLQQAGEGIVLLRVFA
jgi:hypothetical protein